jgi:hypothetical protein
VPSLAMGVALAGLLRDAGDNDTAASALGFVTLLKTLAVDEWALAREAAGLLETLGRPMRAVELWRTLLAIEALPRELRVAWLPEASKAARTAKDFAQATKWEGELTELVPPPQEKK